MMLRLIVQAKMVTHMVAMATELVYIVTIIIVPATFIVHSHSETPGAISLQNAKNTFNWLAIRDGKFIGDVSDELLQVAYPDISYYTRVTQLMRQCSNCWTKVAA